MPAVRFLAVFLSLWLGAAISAAALWNRDFLFPFAPMPPVSRFYLACGFLAILVTEGTLLVGLFSAANSLRIRSSAALILRVLAWALTVATIFVTLVSWTLRAYGNTFLTASFLLNSLADISSVRHYLSLRESLTLASGLAVSILLATVLAIKAPRLSAKQFITFTFIALQGSVLILLSLRLQPQNQLTQLEFDQFRGIASARLSPTASLFWTPLLYGDPYKNARVSVPLTPRYDLATYAQSIDPAIRRPNILVFLIEALRAGEVTRQVNGLDVMPTASKLATRGLNFQRAYSQANESAYSAHSILSGLHPLKSSRRDNFTAIDYPLTRIADLLSPAYYTAYISSFDERWQGMLQTSFSPRLDSYLHAGNYTGNLLPPDPADDGFRAAAQSARIETGGLDDAATVSLLQDWIRDTSKKPERRPFFAITHLETSHFPYEQAASVPARFTPNQLSAAERAQLSFVYYPRELAPRMLNRYWNSLSYIDAQIASTLDLLEETGELENTIIVITGDHGELFHENGHVTHAAALYNRTLNVSLVISGTPALPARSVSEPVSSLDLGPMLLHFAKMPPFAGFQGSLPPSLDPDAPHRPPGPVFSTVQAIAYEDSVLVGPWKFAEHAEGAYASLFNVQSDPLEQHAQPPGSDVWNCLQATLHQFRTNQFGYFASAQLKAGFFPPRHQLADVPACAAAFSAP
jgi:arylsulfatase A-like enzyme